MELQDNWPFRQRYKGAGHTLTSLAQQSRIPRTYLSQYVRGRYNLNTLELERIASILGCSVGEISG